MNADKDFIFLGNRLFDVLDLHDLRWSVSAINGGFHAALANPSIKVEIEAVAHIGASKR